MIIFNRHYRLIKWSRLRQFAVFNRKLILFRTSNLQRRVDLIPHLLRCSCLDLINRFLLPRRLLIFFQQFLNCHFCFVYFGHSISDVESGLLVNMLIQSIGKIEVNNLPLNWIATFNLFSHYVGVVNAKSHLLVTFNL